MASKKFAVKCDAIDGKSTDKFASLAEAGKFLKSHFQGAEYCMDGAVGTDFAKFIPIGFKLSDVGKWSYDEGYPEFEFYDWAGGKLKEIKAFQVVSHSDHEFNSGSVMVDSFDKLDEAIAFALKDGCDLEIQSEGKPVGHVSKGEYKSHEKLMEEFAAMKAKYAEAVNNSDVPF